MTMGRCCREKKANKATLDVCRTEAAADEAVGQKT